jgi:hypothetical protein
MLVFLAGRWALGSANQMDSMMATTDVWEMMRRSADRVGRTLAQKPPSFAQLHHLRTRLAEDFEDGLADRLEEAFCRLAVELAPAVGLLGADAQSSFHRPQRGRTIYGDGSVFTALSDVEVDDDGVVSGSRAVDNPRLPVRFEGKGGADAGTGLPVAWVGCHGGDRWQRMVFGLRLFRDGNEIGASLDLFDRVIDLAGGDVSHAVYDRLASGTHLRHLLKQGIVPLVAMPHSTAQNALVLPADLQTRGYASEGAREKRKGKGARRRSGDSIVPKSKVSTNYLGLVDHSVPGGTCSHELWAVDGSLVTVAPGESVSIDATYVPQVRVDWLFAADGHHPIAEYRVPCRHGDLRHHIDLAGDRPGKNKHRQPLALADWVRPFAEAESGFFRTAGYRSDVESVFSWLKAMLPRERACSLSPNHFYLDMIGAGLLCNAIAWDVHGAQHTRAAQHEARRRARRDPSRQ